MSKLESLEKLREYAENIRHGRCDMTKSTVAQIIIANANAIQDEVDEKYMPLPVDADGVFIHVGDAVVWDTYEYTVTAVGKRLLLGIKDNDSACTPKPCDITHLRQRTVKDVLLDFAAAVTNGIDGQDYTAADIVSEFASELRIRSKEEVTDERA